MRQFTFADGEEVVFDENTTASDLLLAVFEDIFSEIEVISRPMTNFRGQKVGEKIIFRHVPTNIQIEDPKSAHSLLKGLIALLNELS